MKTADQTKIGWVYHMCPKALLYSNKSSKEDIDQPNSSAQGVIILITPYHVAPPEASVAYYFQIIQPTNSSINTSHIAACRPTFTQYLVGLDTFRL